jgi:hypothetical protein
VSDPAPRAPQAAARPRRVRAKAAPAAGAIEGLLPVLLRIAASLEALAGRAGRRPAPAPRAAARPDALGPEQRRALDLFRQAGRPLGRQDLMRDLGKGGAAASMVLQRLVRAGLLRRDGHNRYVLSDRAAEQPAAHTVRVSGVSSLIYPASQPPDGGQPSEATQPSQPVQLEFPALSTAIFTN